MHPARNNCSTLLHLRKDGNPVMSSIMFAAGVVGNVAALAILLVHRKEMRTKTSSFCILVTGLALTDLAGTCVVSPVVFVAYSRNATVLGLVGGSRWLCNLFAFSMMYFSQAAMLILCAMAVERCLAISYPYFYAQHNIRRWAKLSLPAIFTFSGAFCALPFLDIGKYKQYCPGSWCFIQMDSEEQSHVAHDVAFSLSYATLMALLILATFVCNGLVIFSLCQMYRKQKARRRGSVSVAQRRRKSWFTQGEEEVDHLILLALMTVIFVICSLPLSIRAYVGGIAPDHKEEKDMLAFRLSALNPIIDPWLFIIFRRTVFRSISSVFRYHSRWPCWIWTQKARGPPGDRDGIPFQDYSLS